MHARLATILLAAGAAALALTVSAAPSSATPATLTWTVTPGGSSSGAANPFTVGGGGNSFACPDDGQYLYPHHIGPNPYGYVSALSLGTCSGPLGQTFTLTPGNLPWLQNGTSYNSSTGVTTGTITGIHATLSGPSCSATIDGTSSGADNGQVMQTYTNGTGKLSILTTGGNLHVYNVSGCGGLFSNGEAVTFSASYTLAPIQTITGS